MKRKKMIHLVICRKESKETNKKKQKQKNKRGPAAVPLDMVLERCTSTMLHKFSSHTSLSPNPVRTSPPTRYHVPDKAVRER